MVTSAEGGGESLLAGDFLVGAELVVDEAGVSGKYSLIFSSLLVMFQSPAVRFKLFKTTSGMVTNYLNFNLLTQTVGQFKGHKGKITQFEYN